MHSKKLTTTKEHATSTWYMATHGHNWKYIKFMTWFRGNVSFSYNVDKYKLIHLQLISYKTTNKKVTAP